MPKNSIVSPFRFDRNIGKSERKNAKALLSFKQIRKICTKIQKKMKKLSAPLLNGNFNVNGNLVESYGNFNALIFPCCHQLLSSCFRESSKFWRQFQAAKFCKFQYASVLILNAVETSTILPPFYCKLT